MEKTTIINGNHTLAVANDDGVSRSLESIPEYTPLRFTDLKKGVPYLFDLSPHLSHDYFANLATYDLARDDNQRLENYDEEVKDKQLLRVYLKTVDDKRPASHKFLILWSTQTSIPAIFFRRNEKILIQVNEDTNSLTFYAKPILLSQTINLTKDPSFKADTQPVST